MKIAIDIRNIGKKRTGDEVVFFNLVKNLARIDSKNNYLLFTDITDTAILRSMAVKLGIEGKNNFKIIPLKTINKFTWNFWTLPNYLRKNPVDILQVQYITPFFIPKKTKIVTIIHDISFKVFPELIKKTDLFFLNNLIPLSLKKADKIIGVSKFTADEIQKYYKISPDKIDWIHNAVADNFFADYSPEQLEAARKKYALPQKFILYIGTLQPRKNLPVLVEAFVKIQTSARHDIKLVLAGGKAHNFDKKIDTFIKNCDLQNEVLLPGFISEEDKPLVFKLASIFCLPSLYEGFGIPILEAMASGIPVIASDIPPHKEIIGDSAPLFKPEDSDDLAEKLSDILTNKSLRQELIRKEAEQIKKFSWSDAAQKLLLIYEKLSD